ncbi:MAG: hypothetical protein WC373_00735 [Smithella sp.]|jgi:hypothetical protein
MGVNILRCKNCREYHLISYPGSEHEHTLVGFINAHIQGDVVKQEYLCSCGNKMPLTDGVIVENVNELYCAFKGSPDDWGIKCAEVKK